MNGELLKRLILFLFLIANVYGLCVDAEREIFAPAVSTTGAGELIRLGVEITEGKGDILFSVPPYIGVFTQTSLITATKVAFKITGQNLMECTVILNGDPIDTDTIDGPSGGAALTLMIISALQNKTIREDLRITGTIEENGDIGQVGGISEKLEAAALSGTKIFLLPRQDRDTKLALFVIKNKYNVTVVEVADIAKAASIALNGNSNVESNLVLEKNKLPGNLTAVSTQHRNSEELYKIGKSFTSKGESYINAFKPTSDEDRKFIDFFQNELGLANELLENGYLYSGANTAFLAAVDLEFLSERDITTEKINSTIQDISSCVRNIPEGNFTEGNFELMIGSDLRKNWALKKLDEINSTISRQSKVFSPYHEVLFARAWCNISKSLQNSKSTGEELPEAKLRTLAFEKIEQADKALKNKSFVGIEDLLWHLDAAKQAYAKGDYGAAIYNSTYAIAITNATEEFRKSELVTIKERTNGLLKSEVKNFWSTAYKAHSTYYYARYLESNDPFELLVAYRLATYSMGLENATETIRKELDGDGSVSSNIEAGVDSAQKQPDYIQGIVFPAILVMLMVNLLLQLYQLARSNK